MRKVRLEGRRKISGWGVFTGGERRRSGGVCGSAVAGYGFVLCGEKRKGVGGVYSSERRQVK